MLPHDLAVSLAPASGFRNGLVHDYVDVRDDLVIAHLDRLSELSHFARAVANWLVNA